VIDCLAVRKPDVFLVQPPAFTSVVMRRSSTCNLESRIRCAEVCKGMLDVILHLFRNCGQDFCGLNRAGHKKSRGLVQASDSRSEVLFFRKEPMKDMKYQSLCQCFMARALQDVD
jgi:hypothetical protein